MAAVAFSCVRQRAFDPRAQAGEKAIQGSGICALTYTENRRETSHHPGSLQVRRLVNQRTNLENRNQIQRRRGTLKDDLDSCGERRLRDSAWTAPGVPVLPAVRAQAEHCECLTHMTGILCGASWRENRH